MEAIPFDNLRQKHLVVEEKIDGANSGISFDPETLEMKLQSRGHFLTGGPREKHFNLFKQWAAIHESQLMDRLQDRYIAYGEWMYAKHTEFYDKLPHYWMEFDVLDKQTGKFLSTEARRSFWKGLPVVSVPVLAKGRFESLEQLTALIKPSLYKSSEWKKRLWDAATAQGLSTVRVFQETDSSDLAEGLYIKAELGDECCERFKFVRAEFVQQIMESTDHWLSRPIIENRLAEGVDIFGG